MQIIFFSFVFDNIFIYFIMISRKYWLILYSNSEIRVEINDMYVCVVSLLYNLNLRTKSIFVFASYKLSEFRFEPYGYETDTHYQALTVLISNVSML